MTKHIIYNTPGNFPLFSCTYLVQDFQKVTGRFRNLSFFLKPCDLYIVLFYIYHNTLGTSQWCDINNLQPQHKAERRICFSDFLPQGTPPPGNYLQRLFRGLDRLCFGERTTREAGLGTVAGARSLPGRAAGTQLRAKLNKSSFKMKITAKPRNNIKIMQK